MKKWLKILGLALVVAIGLFGWSQWSNYELRASVEQTRHQLRREGFKTELADFNLTPTDEIRRRADALVAASAKFSDGRAHAELQLMKVIGANTALRASSAPFIPSRFIPSPTIHPAELDAAFRSRYMAWPAAPVTNPRLPADLEIEQPPAVVNLWDQIADELGASSASLDAACRTVALGRFQFELLQPPNFLLPHLANVRLLAQALSARAALAIHRQQTAEAFTNLLALTQLCTHWQPEPVEMSHLVRFACAQINQAALWEGLQIDGWTDEQLATLQRQWESAEFFAGLGETMALHRASLVQTCRDARSEDYGRDIGGWGLALRQVGVTTRQSPTTGFRQLKDLWEGYRNHARYRNVGSYEDEKALMLYYRDRELETKQAIGCQTWLEMRAIPGVTNVIAYQSAQPSRVGSLVNLRQMSLGLAAEGRRPLDRAAETEARRRIIVTAIALKRFQLQHGSNPDSLAELTPALLPSVPLDFMDGKELRYQRFEDGRFILYSVGLDCTDDGGQMKTREQLSNRYESAGNYVPFTPLQNTDIVWPKPANEDEVLAYEMSIDETVRRLDELMFREMEKKYCPPQLEQSYWPYRSEFE